MTKNNNFWNFYYFLQTFTLVIPISLDLTVNQIMCTQIAIALDYSFSIIGWFGLVTCLQPRLTFLFLIKLVFIVCRGVSSIEAYENFKYFVSFPDYKLSLGAHEKKLKILKCNIFINWKYYLKKKTIHLARLQTKSKYIFFI